jgi:DDE family transposase/transposase-like protein DUF772
MSLGLTPRQQDMFAGTTSFCESLVAPDSIYALLHRECHRLFPDEMFADLFRDVGRRCVPPMIVAVVMVLQRLEGCSDREAVERFTYDVRWKYAAGGLDFHFPGFVHTVLVDMRARLAASEDPERIFKVVLDVGKRAGLVGRRRVLDSTPIYDAVATMDTVTLLRSAIRRLLAVCESALESHLRGLLARDDDYRDAGKPVCDYDDRQAREALVDALAKDARALLLALDGRELQSEVSQAAGLLASVVGQDLDEGEDGVFRIARRVAKDRVISTVDPDARHGHKTSARGFDGYKGHVAVDPDSELITATTVTAANAGDAVAVNELLADDLPPAKSPAEQADTDQADAAQADTEQADAAQADAAQADTAQVDAAQADAAQGDTYQADAGQADGRADAGQPAAGPAAGATGPLSVYGDSAYGAGEVLDTLEQADAEIYAKVQPPTAPHGRFAKDKFTIDLDAETVTCPAAHTVALTATGRRRVATFAHRCAGCPLADQCTTSKRGRTIHIGPYEQQLTRARERQQNPEWAADYKATRPKVERKISHLTRRKHGGRRARVRGKPKVSADLSLLAAAVNLARLAVLGLTSQHGGWQATTA